MVPQTVALLSLSGDFDYAAKERLASFLDRVKTADVAVIDVSAVTFFDSTAITTLLAFRSRIGGTIRLVEPPSALRRVIGICGLGTLLQVHDTLGSALADLTEAGAIVTHTGTEISKPAASLALF